MDSSTRIMTGQAFSLSGNFSATSQSEFAATAGLDLKYKKGVDFDAASE
jgi:hypothetical protein